MFEPQLKIGLYNKKNLSVTFLGDYFSDLLNVKVTGEISFSIINNGIYIETKNEKYLINERKITFSPQDINLNCFVLKDVVYGKNFHWENKKSFKYRGNLILSIRKDELMLINEIPLELYLKSVICSEMSSNNSIEYLKAHAVISRSWVLAQLRKKTENKVKKKKNDEKIVWYDREDHKDFDFCSDDHCQRYQGAVNTPNSEAEAAVAITRGLVLLNNNIICDTRFSKCCGGITEEYQNVWDESPKEYLTSVIDYKFDPDGFNTNLNSENSVNDWLSNSPTAFCNISDSKLLNKILVEYDLNTKDFYRWQKILTQDKISSLIKTNTKIDFGKIKDLIPISRGRSGRLVKLKIIGTKKEIIVGKELEIRRILSDSHLLSSAFTISRKNIKEEIPEQFELTGAGWGHGVGLCQIGAAAMCELGYYFDEVLFHYFRNTKLKKIY